MKKNIDDYEKLDYYLSLFSSKIKDLTKDLKKIGTPKKNEQLLYKNYIFFLILKKINLNYNVNLITIC